MYLMFGVDDAISGRVTHRAAAENVGGGGQAAEGFRQQVHRYAATGLGVFAGQLVGNRQVAGCLVAGIGDAEQFLAKRPVPRAAVLQANVIIQVLHDGEGGDALFPVFGQQVAEHQAR